MRTNNYVRKLLFASISSSALVGAGYASADVTLEEVIVTATKRGETSLQDAAISVSAVTGGVIEDSGIRHVEDLQAYVPNLVVGDSADTPGDAVVTIRGIGTQILSIGADPSSSVHTDGVYNSRPGTIFSEFLDVERVEVLRGPQGTLYGRNSVGGTINIIHKMASYEPEVKVLAEVGNLDGYRGVVSVNGALVEDTLAGRFAFSRRARDGWITNQVDGDKYGEETVNAFRGALLWDISDTAQLVVKTDWSDKDTDNRPAKLLGTGEDPDDGALSAQLLADNGALPTAADWYAVNQNTTLGKPYRDQDDFGISAELTIELGNYTLTSLTGYRSHESEYLNDTDLTSLDLVNDFLETESSQFSEELRLASNFDGRVNFQASLFYMEDDAELNIFSDLNAGNHPLAAQFFLGFPPTDTSEILVPILQENTTKAMAVFGEIYVEITERLRLTLGGRYSDEEKDFSDGTQASLVTDSGTISFFPGDVMVQFPGKGVAGVIPVNRNSASDSWSKFTPKVVLEYSASEDVLYYFTYAEGFKSGGFDARVAVPGDNTPAFEPESVDNIEIGAKATLWGGRARVNTAIFRMEYTDQQITFVDNESGLPVVTTSNAGESRFQGLEFEGELLLTDNFKAGLGLAFLDAEYITYATERDGDLSGLTPRDAPEWSLNTFLDYRVPLAAGGELLFHLDGSWRDDNVQRASVNSDNQHIIDAYSLWNTRVTYTTGNGDWSVSLWSNNLFDQEYEVSKVDQPFGRHQVYLGMTRTFGATLKMHF